MRNNLVAFIIIIFSIAPSTNAQRFLSDIIISESDKKFGAGTTTIPINYWRFDTCLYGNNMCRYNTSTAVRVKIIQYNSCVECNLSFSSQKLYENELADNIFHYFFFPAAKNKSFLIRKLHLEQKLNDSWTTVLRTDSFFLMVIDSLLLDKAGIIRKAFGKNESENQRTLKIYVLKSVDSSGSRMLHFWVERMGIIKLTDEKCWRYSFEMKDARTKKIKMLFEHIYSVIKKKYKDPYWLGEPCYFE
jgi:hypothetical protein